MLVVVLLFLVVFISFSDQPEDVVISPTIDKVMVDSEVVFDSGMYSSNVVTGNVLAGKLFKKGSIVALFKGKSRVILSSVGPGDLNRMYFRDVEGDAVDVDGDVRDFVWIENAPCGGQVELPSTYDAVYQCSGVSPVQCEKLGACGSIPGTDCYFEKDRKTYVDVEHFSGIFGVDIDILNVQSYPVVGGNWAVRFDTTGIANLTITAVNGTTWTNYSELGYDLKFLEIRCGNEILNYTWRGNNCSVLGNCSVFIENYSCNETGYKIAKVLTSGSHHLKFQFGNITKYAHNWATELSDWDYRRPITLSPATSQGSYQVEVTVGTVSDKIRDDCNDLRFTASDGTTLQDYWKDSGSDWKGLGQSQATNPGNGEFGK